MWPDISFNCNFSLLKLKKYFSKTGEMNWKSFDFIIYA